MLSITFFIYCRIPFNKDLCERIKDVPHVILSDAAFPLHTNIMKPYLGKNLTVQQRIFNYRMSSARQKIENTFGILTVKWRILLRDLNTDLETNKKIVAACVCLHNWLLPQPGYMFKGLVDRELNNGRCIPGLWREDGNSLPNLEPGMAYNSRLSYKAIRDKFCDYFSHEGSVPWQYSKI